MLYALLWGNGDFIKTILLSVNCGRDTDCTAATCGSFLGICHGSAVIPAQYLRKLSPEITLSECIGKIDTIPKTLPDLLERTAKLRQKFARQLPATRYPLYTPYIPGEPAALDSGRWLILDESEHDITALQEDLLKTGRCPEALHRFIIDTAGLTLDLSAHARNANVLNLFTFLNVENEDEEENNNAVLSATADVGMTLWIDRKKIFNHHSRMRSIPSFHRAEGGAAFNYPLQQGDKKLVHIKLYSCIAPLLCTVMFGNGHNDHLDGYKLKI